MNIVILWGKSIKFSKKHSFSLFAFFVVLSFLPVAEGNFQGLSWCINTKIFLKVLCIICINLKYRHWLFSLLLVSQLNLFWPYPLCHDSTCFLFVTNEGVARWQGGPKSGCKENMAVLDWQQMHKGPLFHCCCHRIPMWPLPASGEQWLLDILGDGSLLLPCGLRDQTQAVRLGNKSLRYLTGPQMYSSLSPHVIS